MRKRVVVVVAVLALLVGGALLAFRVPEMARIGAGYVAEQTCGCLFISHRSPRSCHRELEPLAQRVVTVEIEGAAVTARSFFLARATARYRKGIGCSLED